MNYGSYNGVMRDLSSGETEELEAEQNCFNRWFQEDDEEDGFWEFEDTFDDDENKKEKFLQYIAEHIRSVPPYKYLLRYLMLHYNISIGDKNFKGLWNCLKDGSWKVNTKADREVLWNKLKREQGEEPEAFSEEDYNLLMSVLYLNMRDEYEGRLVKKAFTTYYYELVKKFNSTHLRDLALILDMDIETYKRFKTKVLKKQEINFLDRGEVMLWLTLKYAMECGMSNYDAYSSLEKLYPVENIDKKIVEKRLQEIQETERSSQAVEKWALDFLEEEGQLKESFRHTLFQSVNIELKIYFERIYILSSAKVERSVQKEFLKQWEVFAQYMEKYHHAEIDDKIRTDKEKTNDEEETDEEVHSHMISIDYAFEKKYESEMYQLSRQKIYRWLYGNHVSDLVKGTGGKTNHMVDISDANMVRLAPEKPDNGLRCKEKMYEDFFLDSQEFLNTRIRENDFNNKTFTKDETRQRNLLLTIGFLNYVSESTEDETKKDKLDKKLDEKKEQSYECRVLWFEQEMVDILESCGFMTLHSGNAYDVFLKMLLSSDDPMGLFQYIWRRKTNSED